MEQYKRYSEIKRLIKSLEDEEKILKEVILAEIKDKEENEYGKFTKAYRKTYTYSEKVDQLAEKVKLQKYKEEQKGIATVVETPYLLFKEIK